VILSSGIGGIGLGILSTVSGAVSSKTEGGMRKMKRFIDSIGVAAIGNLQGVWSGLKVRVRFGQNCQVRLCTVVVPSDVRATTSKVASL